MNTEPTDAHTESAAQAQAKSAPPALPRNVKLLGWASFFNDVASEMIFPLLPQFLLKSLGGSHFYLGVIEGLADTIASLLKLWSGAWSDRLEKRRGLILFGYSVAALSRPLIGLITLPWQLLAVRVTDRIGKGVRSAPRDALLADSTEPNMRGRAFGFHRGMDHLGAAVGPVLATLFLWLWPNQLRLMFLLTLIPGVCVLLLLAFGLREKPRTLSEKTVAKFQFSLKPFDHQFRLYLLSLLIFTLGNSSDAFLLVRAGELGVSPVLLPMLWFAFHIVKSAGNMVVGKWVDRIGPRLPLILGWLLYAVIYMAFALATSAWQVWVFFLLYALFYALTEPSEKTLVANLADKDRKGLAFGWYNFVMGLGALPASLLFGWLYEDFGPTAAFGCGATLALVAVTLFWQVRVRAD